MEELIVEIMLKDLKECTMYQTIVKSINQKFLKKHNVDLELMLLGISWIIHQQKNVLKKELKMSYMNLKVIEQLEDLELLYSHQFQMKLFTDQQISCKILEKNIKIEKQKLDYFIYIAINTYIYYTNNKLIMS